MAAARSARTARPAAVDKRRQGPSAPPSKEATPPPVPIAPPPAATPVAEPGTPPVSRDSGTRRTHARCAKRPTQAGRPPERPDPRCRRTPPDRPDPRRPPNAGFAPPGTPRTVSNSDRTVPDGAHTAGQLLGQNSAATPCRCRPRRTHRRSGPASGPRSRNWPRPVSSAPSIPSSRNREPIAAVSTLDNVLRASADNPASSAAAASASPRSTRTANDCDTSPASFDAVTVTVASPTVTASRQLHARIRRRRRHPASDVDAASHTPVPFP